MTKYGMKFRTQALLRCLELSGCIATLSQSDVYDSCNRQLSKEMAMLRTTSPTNKEDTEELSTRLEILQEYARQLEKEIEQLREMLHQQYQQPLVVAASSSVSSARDLITIGSEETDIDALMKLMMEAFPTGQEPGVFVYTCLLIENVCCFTYHKGVSHSLKVYLRPRSILIH